MITSAFRCDSGGSEGVPILEWSQLLVMEKIGEGLFAQVYRSVLTLPGEEEVSVALKVFRREKHELNAKMRREALFMLKAEGILGVPKVYGIMETPRVALVMTLCPGRPLKTYRNAEGASVYLNTLIETCTILTDLHERGITHRDLHDKNIIVDTTDRGVHVVSVVDFGLASLYFDDDRDRVDARQIARMTRLILTKVTRTSGPDFSERCRQLQRLIFGDITLTRVLKILHEVVEDHFC